MAFLKKFWDTYTITGYELEDNLELNMRVSYSSTAIFPALATKRMENRTSCRQKLCLQSVHLL